MPHSNDRTLVTAAGDHEIRVFDLEHSGPAAEASSASALASQDRRRGRNVFHSGVRYLSDGNTNCRVYRSHGDRVKRIVTESSPHLFLTCSEDGEVRQWDLRQPSSAYPPPRGRYGGEDSGSVPPPLISYKRCYIDLNTISCSPSQPHYIALGGAHLHCFLHDRRMTGRDKLLERGALPSLLGNGLDTEDDLMGQATQCVRKFAPGGKSKMRSTDNGHITACKISDANPNEIIVSWSGDHIYSFDMLRSPDASEAISDAQTVLPSTSNHRARESGDRKRKRKTGSQKSPSQDRNARAPARQRTTSSSPTSERGGMALRVQYGNGQSEDISIEHPTNPVAAPRESAMNDRQREAYRLAKAVVKLRKNMFILRAEQSSSRGDTSSYAASFTSVQKCAARILPVMTDISNKWRYPVTPDCNDIIYQRALRSQRESAYRFVQAAGVIARALGGHSNMPSAGTAHSSYFSAITFVPNEGPDIKPHEQFSYDFLKAIFLWLDSGVGSLLEGFSTSSQVSRYASRLPVTKDSGIEAIDDELIPYLLTLATDRPIINVDASRFEVDEKRIVYSTEKEAVAAFASALKVPFADLTSTLDERNEADPEELADEQEDAGSVQNRRDALMHWGVKVARGLLLNPRAGVTFAMTERAFGGIGATDLESIRDEERLLMCQEDIDPDEDDPAVESFEITTQTAAAQASASSGSSIYATAEDEDEDEDEEMMMMMTGGLGAIVGDEDDGDEADDNEESDSVYEEEEEGTDAQAGLGWSVHNEEDEEEDEDDEEEDEEDEDEDEDDEDDEEDDEEDYEEEEGEDIEADNEELRLPFYQSAFERRRLREQVGEKVACVPHQRVYSGHCNVRTVKDVNFFGLQDEYVVSGSDDGNFFVWDRKTGQLVNILEGDGEVVNVLQGHPYEPLLAVSGIDHTIKIFSPDSRAREVARLGRGIEAADASAFSSLVFPAGVRGRRAPRPSTNTTSEPAMPLSEQQRAEDDEEYVAANGLRSRRRMHLEYQIVSQNDAERQGGNQEASITVRVETCRWIGKLRWLTVTQQRSMLTALAQHIRRRRNGAGEGEGDDEGGGLGGLEGRVVIGDDCVVM